MSDREQVYQEVEITREEAETSIELANALDRLFMNEDFQKVILNNFFEEEAKRLVMVQCDVAIRNNPVAVQAVKDRIVAIGELNQYFRNVKIDAQQKQRALQDAEEYMAETEADLGE